MDEKKMSVMQKLRAIRERMAAQSGAPMTEVDAEPGESTALPQEPDAAPDPDADGGSEAAPDTPANPAEPPLAIASTTASMWDLAQDEDEDDAPETADPVADDDISDPIAWLEAHDIAEPHAPAPEEPIHSSQVKNFADEAAIRKQPLKHEPGPVPRYRPVTPKSEAAPAAEAAAESEPAPATEPEAGVQMRRAGRVKTRLLGFEHSDGKSRDVFEKARESVPASEAEFPVGWLVVVGGPGRGAAFPLHAGVLQIGRDEDQAIQLDFGDNSISRSNHAALAYDEEERGFFIGHGGKSNLVRLNGKPLLSTESLKTGDEIRIGETTLRLVALCGEHFSWVAQDKTGNS